MLNWSAIASSINHFTKDREHSSSFLRDVEEQWETEMWASQNISLVSCHVHSCISLLFAISPFSRNLLKLAYMVSFLFHLFCNRTRNVCCGHERVLMCQDTALEGQGSSLGAGHLGQEGSGAGSPGLCLLFLLRGGGNFNTSVPTKDSKWALLVIQTEIFGLLDSHRHCYLQDYVCM